MPTVIEPYTDQDAAAVAALWNEEFGSHYPLTPALLRVRVHPATGEPPTGWVARADGQVVAALLARLTRAPWVPAGVGFVTLFAVARTVRRHGIGQALLARLVAEARRNGYTALVFGGGPSHLLPGIPLEAPLATWRFLRKAGAVPREVFHDLLVDLTLLPPTTAWPPSVRLAPARPDEYRAFLAREFPGRWETDVAEAAQAGATILGLYQGDELIGFAAAHPAGEWPPAPSLFWTGTLEGLTGGLGPLGIARTQRNRGYGLLLVQGALAWLRETGHRWVVIDWTDLAPFYGRVGAHIWRTYQLAALPIV